MSSLISERKHVLIKCNYFFTECRNISELYLKLTKLLAAHQTQNSHLFSVFWSNRISKQNKLAAWEHFFPLLCFWKVDSNSFSKGKIISQTNSYHTGNCFHHMSTAPCHWTWNISLLWGTPLAHDLQDHRHLEWMLGGLLTQQPYISLWLFNSVAPLGNNVDSQ